MWHDMSRKYNNLLTAIIVIFGTCILFLVLAPIDPPDEIRTVTAKTSPPLFNRPNSEAHRVLNNQNPGINSTLLSFKRK